MGEKFKNCSQSSISEVLSNTLIYGFQPQSNIPYYYTTVAFLVLFVSCPLCFLPCLLQTFIIPLGFPSLLSADNNIFFTEMFTFSQKEHFCFLIYKQPIEITKLLIFLQFHKERLSSFGFGSKSPSIRALVSIPFCHNHLILPRIK